MLNLASIGRNNSSAVKVYQVVFDSKDRNADHVTRIVNITSSAGNCEDNVVWKGLELTELCLSNTYT